MVMKRLLALTLAALSFSVPETFLSMYLNRCRASEVLKSFCQDDQTQGLCKLFHNDEFKNTSLREIANIYTAEDYFLMIVPSLIVASGIGISMASKKYEKNFDIWKQRKDEIKSALLSAYMGVRDKMRLFANSVLVQFTAFVLIFLVFDTPPLFGASMMAEEMLNRVCFPVSAVRNLKKDCESNFPGINRTDIGNMKALFDQLDATTAQSLQFDIIFFSTLISAFFVLLLSSFLICRSSNNVSENQRFLFRCCRRKQYESIDLNHSSGVAPFAINFNDWQDDKLETYGTFNCKVYI